MRKNTHSIYRIATMTLSECAALIRERRRARVTGKYLHAWRYLEAAYREAIIHNLRVDRRTWIMRDNRIGILSQPVNLSEWPECTPEDARDSLAWEVWCSAVQLYNLEHRL